MRYALPSLKKRIAQSGVFLRMASQTLALLAGLSPALSAAIGRTADLPQDVPTDLSARIDQILADDDAAAAAAMQSRQAETAVNVQAQSVQRKSISRDNFLEAVLIEDVQAMKATAGQAGPTALQFFQAALQGQNGSYQPPSVNPTPNEPAAKEAKTASETDGPRDMGSGPQVDISTGPKSYPAQQDNGGSGQPTGPLPGDQVQPGQQEPGEAGGQPAPVTQPDPQEPDQANDQPIPVQLPGDVVQPDQGEADPGQAPAPDQGVEQQPDAPKNEAPALELGADFDGKVVSGRVTTLDLPGDDVESVSIISGPDFGNVTVNPDNSLALVLTGTDTTGSLDFTVQITRKDGSITTGQINLDVTEGAQEKGWGTGQHYLLEMDANGDMIVEHGENHRAVYVSGSDDALSRSDIAAMEGLRPEQISLKWLLNNPEYGGSKDKALDPDLGMAIWYEITDRDNEPNSNWLMFERGYDYGDVGRVIARGAQGESELNPQLIGAWGEGDKPTIGSHARMYQEFNKNVVIQGVEFTNGLQVFGADNVLLDDIVVTGDELNVKNLDGFTLRNSSVYDVREDEPLHGGPKWNQVADRISGIYAERSEGILVEGTLFDHNGWSADYDYNISSEYGQPPSFYSHNVYFQHNNEDITFRDNITMRGASFGMQIRSGGFVEDNVFLDNNAAVNNFGGNYGGDYGFVGNYSLFADNLVTSGGHKRVSDKEGALSLGIGDYGSMSTRVDNIVTHLADPNNAQEQAEKTVVHKAVQNSRTAEKPVYDDTIVYNWTRQTDQDSRINGARNTVENSNYDVLDQTTIQLFAASLLGRPDATIEDLADFLRANSDGALDGKATADVIIAYFQAAFGIAPGDRISPTTLEFVPDDLGDGVRWDNRMNWSTEDLPGTIAGDSVDLNGNWVQYGGTNRLVDLEMGDGGKLAVTNGYLEVQEDLSVGDGGGEIHIDRSGQLWTNGYKDGDKLEIDAEGGRFANTGLVRGNVDLKAADNAQVILASEGGEYRVGDGDTLHIVGDDVKIGFDGKSGDSAKLTLSDDATLRFSADDGDLGLIQEFYSGHYDAPKGSVSSIVALNDANLRVDLAGITDRAEKLFMLINADEVTGTFDKLEVSGLDSDRDATIIVDYEADAVFLQLGADGAGRGRVSVETSDASGTTRGVQGEVVPVESLVEDSGISWI